MRLFELRACWEVFYDCPDEGMIKICDKHETVAFSVDNDQRLRAIAAELAAGFKGRSWSKRRINQLRKLYPGYDDFRDTTYVIVEVSKLVKSAG
jgi:hypothetical protein